MYFFESAARSVQVVLQVAHDEPGDERRAVVVRRAPVVIPPLFLIPAQAVSECVAVLSDECPVVRDPADGRPGARRDELSVLPR